MKLDKILMPTDFSECAQSAFNYALFLAERYDAELHLVHVVTLGEDLPEYPTLPFPSFEDIAARLDTIAHGEMSRLVEGRSDVVRLHERIKRAIAPAPAIAEYAQQENIDLVVIGTHGRRGPRRWWVGSVTEEVVRTAPCPVLTIRSATTAPDVRKLERVLVPYDFSPAAQRSLKVATDIAAEYASNIDVLHVMAPEIAPGGVVGAPIIRATPNLSQELKAQLENSFRDFETSGIPMASHVLTGSVAWSITDFAKTSGAGLIVIATEGLSGLQHLMIGSVTERVVRASTCPVLVLRRHSDNADSSALDEPSTSDFLA